MGFRVCVCHFFYDDKAMGNHITLSQLDAAAPESSYPFGDKPVSQPALSQTFVGHSVIVVRRATTSIRLPRQGFRYRAFATGLSRCDR